MNFSKTYYFTYKYKYLKIFLNTFQLIKTYEILP